MEENGLTVFGCFASLSNTKPQSSQNGAESALQVMETCSSYFIVLMHNTMAKLVSLLGSSDLILLAMRGCLRLHSGSVLSLVVNRSGSPLNKGALEDSTTYF